MIGAKASRVLPLVAVALAVMLPGTVLGKSAYVIANHTTRAFDAWNITPSGTLSYQQTNSLTHASAPGDVAVHDGDGTMFISSEGGTSFELYDGVNLQPMPVQGEYNIGVQFAGMEVNEQDNIVYGAQRATGNLYEMTYDPVTRQITGHSSRALTNSSGLMGIGFDDENQILWVADGYGVTNQILAYDVDDSFNQIANITDLSHIPVDLTVDSVRGMVYTVSTNYGAGSPGTSTLISQYEIDTGIERVFDMGQEGVGVAVDEDTGHVYVTTSPRNVPGYSGHVRVFDPTDWSEIDTDPLTGSPAGIGIGNISYNPLDLQKVGPASADLGDLFDFTIDLQSGTINYTNAILKDTLAPEMSFVSATGGGVYSVGEHTVTWDLGTIMAGASPMSFGLTAAWNGAEGDMTYTNYATLSSDQIEITRSANVQAKGVIIPEPATIVIWSLLGVCFAGAYRWRRRNGWSKSTTRAIHEVIDRG